MVLGGFVLAKPDIKIWWNWAYYVSPITYAQVGTGCCRFLLPCCL